MVNLKKQEKLKKEGVINKKKSQFRKWLIDYFGDNDQINYFNYWGAINGAIHKKLNNWDPNNEKWFKRGNIAYAQSNKEIMLPKSILSFPDTERTNILWDSTKAFLSDPDIELEVAWIDANSLNDAFSIFKLIDEVNKYDLLFLKNMTLGLERYLTEFGISESIDYIFIFYTKEASNRMKERLKKKGLEDSKTIKVSLKNEPLYLKEDKIGFELYQNLTEWKKELTAASRDDPEYRKMRQRVLKRDNSTCQCCGYNPKKDNNGLVVHHIYGFKNHLDYRTEDSNCITLCTTCHTKYHSLYGRNIKVNPVNFVTFIRDFGTYTSKTFQSTFD